VFIEAEDDGGGGDTWTTVTTKQNCYSFAMIAMVGTCINKG